jgi:hypothetical protein
MGSNGACVPLAFMEVRPGPNCDADGIERRYCRVSTRGGGVAGFKLQGVVLCIVWFLGFFDIALCWVTVGVHTLVDSE